MKNAPLSIDVNELYFITVTKLSYFYSLTSFGFHVIFA